MTTKVRKHVKLPAYTQICHKLRTVLRHGSRTQKDAVWFIVSEAYRQLNDGGDLKSAAALLARESKPMGGAR